MIFLDPIRPIFPNPREIHSEEGIVAVGGNLNENTLLEAYKKGIFPWFEPEEQILWWCPDPRFVLFPHRLKISKSMKKIMTKNIFTFSENTCFEKVMENCQKIFRPNQNGTWISEELIQNFTQLHQKKYAHSVEVWHENQLVGGFYGLWIGDIFCGESMFSKMINASKAGFIYFVSKYKDKVKLIDCQVHTQHLESLGAEEIPKNAFLNFLPKT